MLGFILAGVVVFHPDPIHLRDLVENLRKQASEVILFLNSTIPDDLREDLAAVQDVSFIQATSNLGVGVGLNVLGLQAIVRGASAIVFFDQDSSPSDSMIQELAATWARLRAAGHHPAVVSPLLTTKLGATGKAPTYKHLELPAMGNARRVAYVPTSGSLITTAVLRRSGFFRGDFFIDGIDIEWCFRVSHQGYSCWVDEGCMMPHAVGTGVIGSQALGWQMPKQHPFRMYCVLRNTMYGLRLAHVPLGWKMRQIAYLPLQTTAYILHHRLRWPIVKLLLLGLYDGLIGCLGPPRGLAL